MSASPMTPSRRVLGDLPINTPTTTYTPRGDGKAIKTENLRGGSSTSRLVDWDEQKVHAGIKRSIHELEGSVKRVEARRSSAEREGECGQFATDDEMVKIPLTHAEASTLSPSANGEAPVHVVGCSRDDEEISSQSSVKDSLSSLIDFNQGEVSERSESMDLLPSVPAAQLAAASHAEALRLRLRVAMFKVRTNQTNIPLSQLQISSRQPTQTPRTHDSARSRSITPKASVPALNARATSKLLPAPVLVPTAYSASHVTEAYIPSSPPEPAPSKHYTEENKTQAEFATLVVPRRRQARSPTQLSSPPDSQEREDRLVREDVNLTSSVVKGRAANGLLKLMNIG
ncbi:MAG: hypothetical protein M1827_004859 [Pycnora praestabilis]|nr:MAG: hypothetical protein M1827_004859 [Pycnora praestabilis]